MKNGSRKESKVNDTAVAVEQLKKLYQLPTIEYKERVGVDFYHYVKQRHYFFVIAAFDLEGRLLIFRRFGSGNGWELLGGSVDKKFGLNFTLEAHEFVKRDLGVKLFDIQPIALVKNTFSYESDTIVHEGLALMGYISGEIRADNDYDWGFFRRLPKRMFTDNQRIAEIALRKNSERFGEYVPADDEVKSSGKSSKRHVLHQLFVGKTIGKISSNKLRKAIIKEIRQGAADIIDTSSGDDQLPLLIGKKRRPRQIVCNDISPSHLTKLAKRINPVKLETQYVFTHHDILNFPIQHRFEVVISKNTLHHLSSDDDLYTALQNFCRLGKKVIIVDIEDPINYSLLSRLWNYYYVAFLDDQGDHFLTFDKFKRLLRERLPVDSKFSLKRIRTLKGSYLFAVIDNAKSSRNQ